MTQDVVVAPAHSPKPVTWQYVCQPTSPNSSSGWPLTAKPNKSFSDSKHSRRVGSLSGILGNSSSPGVGTSQPCLDSTDQPYVFSRCCACQNCRVRVSPN